MRSESLPFTLLARESYNVKEEEMIQVQEECSQPPRDLNQQDIQVVNPIPRM